MSNIQRIIGVDPGLTITGFGILDHKKDQIRLIAHGTIKPPSQESLPNRQLAMKREYDIKQMTRKEKKALVESKTQ